MCANLHRQSYTWNFSYTHGDSRRELNFRGVDRRRLQRHQFNLRAYFEHESAGDCNLQHHSKHRLARSHHFPGAGESLVRSLFWRNAAILGPEWLSRPVIRRLAPVQSYLRNTAACRAGPGHPGLRSYQAAAQRLQRQQVLRTLMLAGPDAQVM